jgi:hypothetical protein
MRRRRPEFQFQNDFVFHPIFERTSVRLRQAFHRVSKLNQDMPFPIQFRGTLDRPKRAPTDIHDWI